MYQGMTQEFVYNHLYPVWFGTATSISVVLAKVLFDLLVQTTLVTLPIAYLTKSVIYRYSIREALRRYMDDIRNHGLLKKYYLLWGPVQMLTFSVVPEHLRVTFIACVSFFWLIILSSIASKKPVTESTTEASDEVIEECALEDGLTCNIDG
jgi:protein Mpv17